MGSAHAMNLAAGKVPDAVLTAVCDLRPERLEWAKNTLGDEVQRFVDPEEFFRAKAVDAVMVCTPHYDHPPLAIRAFENGLHVLVEKPAGVYTKQVREMNEAAAGSDKVFGIMYNQRTNPLYQKARELVKSGNLVRSAGRTGSSRRGTVPRVTTTAADGEQPGAGKAEVSS